MTKRLWIIIFLALREKTRVVRQFLRHHGYDVIKIHYPLASLNYQRR